MMHRTLLASFLVIAGTPAMTSAADIPALAGEPVRASWFSCPAERRVRVNLDAWKNVLEGRPGVEAEASLLARLGLPAVPDPASSTPPPDCKPGEEPKLKSVEILAVDLTDARDLDRVVRVRYESCTYPGHEGLPLLSQRTQVLRPLAAGDGVRQDEWCAMGNDLSLDQPAWELPCPRGEDLSALPRELSFENVLDAGRKSIKVVDRAGACDDTGTWAHQQVSYWDAGGRTLERIFVSPTFEVDGPSARVRTVRLEGEFPRRIVVTERARCLTIDGTLPAPECAEEEPTMSVFSWRGGAYRSAY